jgi:hypothetical protein
MWESVSRRGLVAGVANLPAFALCSFLATRRLYLPKGPSSRKRFSSTRRSGVRHKSERLWPFLETGGKTLYCGRPRDFWFHLYVAHPRRVYRRRRQERRGVAAATSWLGACPMRPQFEWILRKSPAEVRRWRRSWPGKQRCASGQPVEGRGSARPCLFSRPSSGRPRSR